MKFNSVLQYKFMQDKDMDFYTPEEKNFGNTIKPFDQNQKKSDSFIVISGFPYDEGTKRNGGRVGGAVGSYIFRKTLLEHDIYPKQSTLVYDAGDIEKDLQLELAHEELFQKNHELLKLTKQLGLLFVIGGSNDQSYQNVRALMELYPKSKIGVINIDAHFDVRPLKQGKSHSGSPFRQMLQNSIFIQNKSKFVQFAVKGATCSKPHFDYLQQKKADVYWLEKNIRRYKISENSQYITQAGQLFDKIITQLENQCEHLFVSFDVDSINCKWMPGVSAPSVLGGLSNDQAIQIMKIAGLSKKVKLVDFSQFNPAVESLISSRMLVQMFFTLSQSFSNRNKIKTK